MELFRDLLVKMLESETIKVDIMLPYQEFFQLVQSKYHWALSKIHDIIRDDSLNDFECVEQIVGVFEQLGSDGGNRHDFG